jgi:ubiquinone/menaquinone biosynthesis C-methylase UbiE
MKRAKEVPVMDKPEPDFSFKFMAFGFKFRDIFLPRMNILKEVGIKRGFQVLDYGCGPGGYIPPLAKLVGESGTIYALDIHPIAIQMVQKLFKKKKLTNVKTILSDGKTGLPDSSMDAVLFYDTYHCLSEPDIVLRELHRVLKPKGTLSFTDHHMKENEIITTMTKSGLFNLSQKAKRTFRFLKK